MLLRKNKIQANN